MTGRWERLLVAAAMALPACAAAAPETRLTGAAPGAPALLAPDPGGRPAAAPPASGAESPAPATATAGSGSAIDADDEDVDDGLELEAPGSAPGPGGLGPGAAASPALSMTDAEIEAKLLSDPGSLGSMSVGSTNAGALVNGVQMPKGDRWQRVESFGAWGTQETVDDLTRCIDAVNAQFPDTPPMFIGHIGAKDGGHLSPHKSHQAGRDVDASYYLTSSHKWYARPTALTLDRPRTWAFLRALITETDVELILMDTSIQGWLREYAIGIGEDEAWLGQIFQVGSTTPRPLVRYAKGHATHVHVRFYNPVAQELGRRAYPALVKLGRLKAPSLYIEHKVKKGQTLGSLANRYGTTVKAIQQANGLRSTFLQMGRSYHIPHAASGARIRVPGPAVIPARRLPPPLRPAASATR